MIDTVVGSFRAGCIAALPWLAVWRPHWAPVALVGALLSLGIAGRGRRVESWAAAVVALSALLSLAAFGGWQVAFAWFALAAVVGALVWLLPRRGRARPDVADAIAVTGWGGAFLLRPELLAATGGGWIAPAVLLLASRRLALVIARRRAQQALDPVPPSRGARGTLSLRGVVVADEEGLARSIPIDLELRAGSSLAILCDTGADGVALAELLAGRRAPAEGEITVDGMPLTATDRLVATAGLEERFLFGSIDTNLTALCAEEPNRETLAAVEEACALSDVATALDDRPIMTDGSPLDSHHRLLLLVARVIPSSYRVLVVVDPMPWVNAVRGELWRNAVVRASVGRTAIWITPDRDLASRADQLMELHQSALRPVAAVD